MPLRYMMTEFADCHCSLADVSMIIYDVTRHASACYAAIDTLMLLPLIAYAFRRFRRCRFFFFFSHAVVIERFAPPAPPPPRVPYARVIYARA